MSDLTTISKNSIQFVTLTPSQAIISDLADALGDPPFSVGDTYLATCQRAAAYVVGADPDASNDIGPVVPLVDDQQLLSDPSKFFAQMNVANPQAPATTGEDGHIATRNAAFAERNRIFDFVDKVSDFAARAKNAGFAPPDNPFSFIMHLIQQRLTTGVFDVPRDEADDIVFNIRAYVDLLRAEAAGGIDLGKRIGSSSQISMATLSMEGIGSSGNPGVDLMKFLPDIDAVREERVRQNLSVLDFSKRIPRVTFTAEYSPDGEQRGALVGWRKMPDASGYVLTRHSVFSNETRQFNLSNEDVRSSTEKTRDYFEPIILSFYKDVDANSIIAFLDDSIEKNSYYVYRIGAFQVQNVGQGSVFDVPMVPANMSLAQRNAIISDMTAAQGAGSQDLISPYPFISQRLYGDTRFDWIIAALNVQASLTRGDDRQDTRLYSYVGAQFSFLQRQMDAGKFFMPKNVNDVVAKITEAISSFGVSQTLSQILDGTGTLFHFEGKEPRSSADVFQRAGAVGPADSNLIVGVLSAVDPETAILDLRILSTNMPAILKGSDINPTSQLSVTLPSAGSMVEAIPAEISIPDPSDVSIDSSRFFDNKAPAEDLADLTTFDGIGKLMHVLRIYSDFGSDRGGSISFGDKTARPTSGDLIPIKAAQSIAPSDPNAVDSNVAGAQKLASTVTDTTEERATLARVLTKLIVGS